MAREKKQEESGGGAPEWMNTYADMVTLLLCFFVLLFSFSTIDAEKWKALVSTFTGAVWINPGGPTLDPQMGGKEEDNDFENAPEIEDISEFAKIAKELEALAGELAGELAANGVLGDVFEVAMTDYEITVRFSAQVLFDLGSADLKAGTHEILDRVIYVISPYADEQLQSIRIEGHTDNLPIRTDRFPNNWWLSQGRAGNVLMYLLDKFPDIPPEKYSCLGRGEYAPIADNDTEEGRSKNRRVEFILVRKPAALTREVRV